MRRTLALKPLWAAAVVVVAIVAVIAWTFTRNEGHADKQPGDVPQAVSAHDQGVTVTVGNAVFSATAIDVTIYVVFDTPGAPVAGARPSESFLNGVSATSMLVSEGGRAVLRFPAANSPVSGPVQLSIAAVQVLGADGRPERVPGRWQLQLQPPKGDDAAAASKLETFPPVAVDLLGNRVQIEGFRTSAGTVIRYKLPPELRELRPPVLLSTGRVLQQLRSERASLDGPVERWFEPTPFGTAVTVAFNDLTGPAAGVSQARAIVALDPFVAPSGGSTSAAPAERLQLAWHLVSAEGVAPRRVEWHRDFVKTTVIVTVDGLWDPEPARKPALVADGVALFVGGVGLRPAEGERTSETAIQAELVDGKVPSTLVLTMGAVSQPLAAVEVTLTP